MRKKKKKENNIRKEKNLARRVIWKNEREIMIYFG